MKFACATEHTWLFRPLGCKQVCYVEARWAVAKQYPAIEAFEYGKSSEAPPSVSIQNQMIDTPKGCFQVRRQGPSEAPLILGLHGFPDTAATFDALGAAFVQVDCQFAAPQMRGYAPSILDMPRTRTLFDALAADALAIADALAPGRPFAVVGHDNGAFAAYSLLRLAGPRATAAVTLTAAHPAAVFKNSGKLPAQMWRSRYAILFQVPRLSEWWASRSDFAYLEVLWKRWAAPGWVLPSQHLAEVRQVMRASWPAPLLYYRAMPFSGDETKLAQPTLYLIGDRDGCVMVEAGAGQERFFTGEFRSDVVAGAGHFLHLEQPDVVVPKVVNWMTRHGRLAQT